MRPVTDAFQEAVHASHQIATLVSVLTATEEIPLTAAVAGTVTLDQPAATRGRCDLTLVDDGTLGLVPRLPADLLTPYGNEIRASRGVLLPTGPELVSLGIFRIEDVEITDGPEGLQIQVTGQDRSARVIDARFEEPYQVAGGTNAITAIAAVIAAAWPDVETDLTPTSRTSPQVLANEGDDRWAFAQSLATSIGYALYFDGDGVLIGRPVATSTTPVDRIAEGEGGVLVRAGRRWTRQGTFNRVIATGENTGEAAPARGVATDLDPTSPTYYYGDYGRVPRFYSSPFIATDDQAADAAAAILARELGTTQQVSFGSIVNPALEPDDVIAVRRDRAGIDEDHIIDRLTIPLGHEEAMSGATRATTTTGAPE